MRQGMGVHDVYYSRRHRLGFLSRSLSKFPPTSTALDYFFFRRPPAAGPPSLAKKTRKLQTLFTVGTALDAVTPQPLLACMVAVMLRH